MTEPAKATNHENEPAQEDNGETDDLEEYERDELDPSVAENTSFLVELNLIIIVLSLFSLSTEDCFKLVERKGKCIKDHDEAKACLSSLSNLSKLDTKRATNEVRVVGRRPQRFHTTIKDSRHGRRM